MRQLILVFLLALFCCNSFAQKNIYWKPVSINYANKINNGKVLFTKNFSPAAYATFVLDEKLFRNYMQAVPKNNNVTQSTGLKFIITIPVSANKTEQFTIVEVAVMDKALAAKYPNIRAFTGWGTNNPNYTLHADLTPLGFHATISLPGKPTIYVNPINLNKNLYAVYARNENDFTELNKYCLTPNSFSEKGLGGLDVPSGNADDGKLRTFKIALCSTGEFSLFFLTGNEKNKADSISSVLSALTTILVRNNAIYERDLSVRLVFVSDEDKLIFLDPKSDGFNSFNLNARCQKTCDSIIGNDNYDIGHVLHKGADNGNAGCVGCVCKTGSKGSGMTSYSNPSLIDYLVVDYWSHEVGHQFGANHTFSRISGGAEDEPEGTQVQIEPGSGSTTMGYAGITGQFDVQKHSDDYFSCASIAQITNFIKNTNGGGKCANVITTLNKIPTANAGKNYTIPKLTPFILAGESSDADANDVLSYTWEEIDNRSETYSGFPQTNTNKTHSPQFRSIKYNASPNRMLPNLSTVLKGATSNQWEALPEVSRDLNFRFTVRDNHTGGGANEADDMVVTVSDLSGPFVITYPESDTITVDEGTPISVRWDVAKTNTAPVNCTSVNILFSIDEGETFPYIALSNTPNDGSEEVIVPIVASATSKARIKVEGVDNIFFDINNKSFKINKSFDVEYLSFTGERIGNSAIQLQWVTARESGNDHFEVERSKDNVNFKSIGTVPAGSNPTQQQQYAFRDDNPNKGPNHYRLKQVSIDGSVTYSSEIIISINYTGVGWILKPNPAVNNGFISFTDPANNVQVMVTDATGKVFFTLSKTQVLAGEQLQIPVANFSTGIYFINVNTDTEKHTERLIVAH